MENEKGYNGWSNYETWNVKLWMDNDGFDFQDRAEELIQEAIDNDESDPHAEATNALKEEIESSWEDFYPDVKGVFADLLSSAWREVNWYEIAEHIVSDVDIYSAGWNMPGYMPDNPPALFLSFDQARDYIVEEVNRAADESETALESEIPSIEAQTGDFTIQIGNYVYWVAKQ